MSWGRRISRIVAVLIFALGVVSMAGGVAFREFALFAVFFVLGGVYLVIESIHLFFTGADRLSSDARAARSHRYTT